MTDGSRVRVGFIGVGSMARHHLAEILARPDTEVTAICEPSPLAAVAATELFARHGVTAPPNEPDWRRFIDVHADRLDAVFIITPHALHHAQATACLEAG